MGLFSDGKKFGYQMGVNGPAFSYEDFVNAIRDYVEGGNHIPQIKEHGFTIENAKTTYTPYTGEGDGSDFPYRLDLTLAPYGTISIEALMKGEKQGLVLPFYMIFITGNLKKADKAWFQEYANALHKYYEAVFAAYKPKKDPVFYLVKHKE
jgi:hypothetical protein